MRSLPSTFFARSSTAASSDFRRAARFAVRSSAGATSCTLKYGALGSADGRVSITWALDDAGAILHWQETGGPPVTSPNGAGFGTMLIERQAARELAGTATIEYPREGVRATLAIPDDPELFLRTPAPGQ